MPPNKNKTVQTPIVITLNLWLINETFEKERLTQRNNDQFGNWKGDFFARLQPPPQKHKTTARPSKNLSKWSIP